MKAVIMAGGFGTRLLPVTADQPKPMIKLLDKPVIQYTLELLKQHNITDACVTLLYLPKNIESFLKANDGFGVNVTYITEEKPVGTAGSVKLCKDFLDGDDFIVISGDAVCDFDLSQCIKRHYELDSKASILLYSHPRPLEFGLVVTNGDSRIRGFVEKPSWDKVETNLINTGIYIFSNDILEKIPDDKPWDFGKDVFPSLLKENYPMYGIEAEGYWCDVGSPLSYKQCTRDVLDGRVRLSVPESAPAPDDVSVIPPVYLSGDAHIAADSVIGPYSVIGSGSVVGKGSRVNGSIIDGGVVMEDCDVEGSILCRGAQVQNGAKLNEGCVIGGETVIGSNAVLMPGVSVWPRQKVEPGQLVSKSIIAGSLKGFPEFIYPGIMQGKYNSTITPELCFELGAACASLGKVGLAKTISPASNSLAASFSSGVTSAGGKCIVFDIDFRVGAAFMGHSLDLPITAFISENNGDTEIIFTENSGLPITRDTERKLEAIFTTGRKYAPSDSTAMAHSINGSRELYSASAVRLCGSGVDKADLTVGVIGNSAESDVLRDILVSMGCGISESGYGVPCFEPIQGGTGLRARDENGNELNSDQILCMCVQLELELGGGDVAVPLDAPMVIDDIGRVHGRAILRVGRDKGGDKLYKDEPWLWDGIFAAVKIVSAMSITGSSLMDLAHSVPDFAVTTREVVLAGSRGDIMRALSEDTEFSRDEGSGLLFTSKKGFARVKPMSDLEALMITAESLNLEAAEELCGHIRDRISGIERKGQ